MNVYLLPFVGTGTHADPFRPQGVEQLGGLSWSMLDLRADPTLQNGGSGLNGWAIVGTEGVIDVSGAGNGRELGGLDSTLGAVLRTAIRAALGITSTDDGNANTPRALIRALFTGAGRADGTRWRNVAAERRGSLWVFDVWLNGELVSRDTTRVVAGGADYTNDFNRADGTSVGNPTTLTEYAGSWSTVSNRAQCDSATDSLLRDDTNFTSTNDQYAEVLMYRQSGSSKIQGGPAVRCASGAWTLYEAEASDVDGNIQIWKAVAGSWSQVGSNGTITFSSGQKVRLTVSGSTLRASYNDVELVVTTDTSIASGTRCGIYAVPDSSGEVGFDSFAFGDLAATSFLARRRRPPFALLRGGF